MVCVDGGVSLRWIEPEGGKADQSDMFGPLLLLVYLVWLSWPEGTQLGMGPTRAL